MPLLFTPLNVPGAVYPLARSPVVYSLNALWLYILSHVLLLGVQRGHRVTPVALPAPGRKASAGVSAGGGWNHERADFAPAASAPIGPVGRRLPDNPGLAAHFSSGRGLAHRTRP